VGGDSQVGVAPTTLTFTPLDWNLPQTATATAIDDAIAEGPHTGVISSNAASADVKYGGTPVAPVTANITDNDFVGVQIVESALSTDVAEGGATDDYTVELTSQPSAPVTVTTRARRAGRGRHAHADLRCPQLERAADRHRHRSR